jgi:hypothetical protein
MGTSTDANIAYGIDLGADMYEMPWYDEVRVEDEDAMELFYEWNEKEYGKVSPFEIFMHCSYECPMYILGLNGSDLTANRGDAVDFEPSKLQEEVTEEQKKLLTDMIAKYNIKGEGGVTEPSWLLYSLWG